MATAPAAQSLGGEDHLQDETGADLVRAIVCRGAQTTAMRGICWAWRRKEMPAQSESGQTTRSKKLLGASIASRGKDATIGAPGRTTRSKDATSTQSHKV